MMSFSRGTYQRDALTRTRKYRIINRERRLGPRIRDLWKSVAVHRWANQPMSNLASGKNDKWSIKEHVGIREVHSV